MLKGIQEIEPRVNFFLVQVGLLSLTHMREYKGCHHGYHQYQTPRAIKTEAYPSTTMCGKYIHIYGPFLSVEREIT